MLEIDLNRVKVEILNKIIVGIHDLLEQTSTVEGHVLVVLVCCCHTP